MKRKPEEENEKSKKIKTLIPKITEKFDFKKKIFNSKEHHSIMILGPRRTGKSNFIASIFKNLEKKFDLIIIFCNNLQSSVYNFLKKDQRLLVFDRFQPKIINELDYYQSETKNFLNILFLFDDCSNRSDVKYNNSLLQLFIRGRNIRASVIFSTQSLIFVSKDGRQNLDFLVTFNPKSIEATEALSQYFLKEFIEPPENITKKSDKLRWYKKFIMENTKDFHAMIMDFNTREIFTHKAPLMGKKKNQNKKNH